MERLKALHRELRSCRDDAQFVTSLRVELAQAMAPEEHDKLAADLQKVLDNYQGASGSVESNLESGKGHLTRAQGVFNYKITCVIFAARLTDRMCM